MVLSTSLRSARRWSRLRFVVLLLVTVLVGHNAVFAAQFGIGDGFRQAMTTGGHDAYWIAFSVVIVALGTFAFAREAIRGLRLSRRVAGQEMPRALGAAPPERAGVTGYFAELRRIWPRLFVATAALFTIQENIEHIAGGQAPHGVGSLIGSDHPYAVPVLAIVVAIAAALGALIRWQIRLLEVRAARAAASTPRPRGPRAIRPETSWADVAALSRHAWFLARLDAGRAPPLGA